MPSRPLRVSFRGAGKGESQTPTAGPGQAQAQANALSSFFRDDDDCAGDDLGGGGGGGVGDEFKLDGDSTLGSISAMSSATASSGSDPIFLSWGDAKAARDVIDRLMYADSNASALQGAVKYFQANPGKRRWFLAGLAHYWVQQWENHNLPNFKPSRPNAVLQRAFPPASWQEATRGLVDVVLHYAEEGGGGGLQQVLHHATTSTTTASTTSGTTTVAEKLLESFAKSGLVCLEWVVMLLCEDVDRKMAMDLALALVNNKEGMVARRRNEVSKLLSSASEPPSGEGLGFQHHRRYHDAFKYEELPAIFNESGLRVAGEYVLPVYHSSSIARMIPAFDTMIGRLLEVGRGVELKELIHLCWPLYHTFHQSPINFVKEILIYYDGCKTLDRSLRLELVRLIPGLRGMEGVPQRCAQTWATTFRYLYNKHFK
eukprot:CAMPEP_0167784574 /NCGR_PEP_ID=MMETSP0111_2-20121227/7716_1 /TAXON_ID=91324 /ORGANISM="Lotharella globosa, Strain CCCM811" /LENGTH=428 /DNA_ID=CAMNT_0007675667 /DNA_START=79 /DNA_END=1363 /DNA_ORIENTATION=+